MWYWIFGLVAAALFLSALDNFLARRRSRAQAAEAIRVFGQSDSDNLEKDLAALTERSPASALAWYLLGTAQLRRGGVQNAARSFGMAHHRDCGLESAALLTFACLKSREGDEDDLIHQIVTTWGEMKRPDLAATEVDRVAAACISLPGRPENLSTLGVLTWSAGNEAVRKGIRARMAAGVIGESPLLTR